MFFTALLKCSTDLKCASRTVRSYMNAYARDCNGDGLITCDDYIRMHKFGAWSCNTEIDPADDFWKIYQECKTRVVESGQNI